jgi:hypothetical protein
MRLRCLTSKSFLAIMRQIVGKRVRRLQIVECITGHYEAHDVEVGMVYRWVPANALVECDCGQLFSAEESTAACPKCGADHRGVVRGLEEDKPLTEEEAYYPTYWEYEAWMKDEGSHRRHPERLYSGGLFSGLATKDELNRILDMFYGT